MLPPVPIVPEVPSQNSESHIGISCPKKGVGTVGTWEPLHGVILSVVRYGLKSKKSDRIFPFWVGGCHPFFADLCNFAVAFQNCIIEYVQSLRVGERNWYQFAHSHGMARKVRDFMVLKSSQP